MLRFVDEKPTNFVQLCRNARFVSVSKKGLNERKDRERITVNFHLKKII